VLLAMAARAPDHPPLAAIGFLVDAVARPDPPAVETPSRLAARAIFVIELFQRLEAQERMAAARMAGRPHSAI